MKILMINKFLYPNGGSETYVFKLGNYLQSQGHEVQYFGMEHEGRCVGNRVNAYTSDMDFHGGSKLSKLTYPIKTIYSSEARKQIRKVLEDFQPDVVHLNNFTYQITPSVILEVVKWRKQNNRPCRIVFTAHDYNLICPNHMLNNPNTRQNCEKCLGGHFINCTKGKCIHGSTAKSAIGTAEGYYWKWRGTYKYIDSVICCSEFMKTKMDTNPLFKGKTIALHNFIDKVEWKETEKKDYVLYFGRFSEEKGINTLIETVMACPDIPFVFAGNEPLLEKVNALPNVQNVGFKTGEELDKLIREARFSICPSEVHENCPFSVMGSQERGTPVVGAKVGGIPELIDDRVNGRLFERKNSEELANIIQALWNDPETLDKYRLECKKLNRDGLKEYYGKIIGLYTGDMGGVLLIIPPVKSDYVIYFGRYSEEKGIGTLIEVCRSLPHIQFIFAGTGPLEENINKIANIKNVGFKSGKELEFLISGASFSIYPSEWYENCPFSVMESQMYGTPVLGANIGGIPELIQVGKTGELFTPSNKDELTRKIEGLWINKNKIDKYTRNCKYITFDNIQNYYAKIMRLYKGEQ